MNLTFDTTQNSGPVSRMLGHHDVVFRAPVCDPTYGMPIGNGESGALLWLDEDTLHVQYNRPDCIDDIDPRRDGICSWTDERNSVAVNGVQLNLRFGCPLFGSLYQKRYEGRISLADAQASVDTETPFGTAHIRACASSAFHCTVLSVDADFTEEQPLELRMQRFGSRTFQYWWGYLRKEPEAGLSGTDAFADGDRFGIVQTLHGCAFCVSAAVVSDDGTWKTARKSSHIAECTAEENKHRSFRCYMTFEVGKDAREAREKADSALERALAAGYDAILSAHRAEWADFWEKSYVVLPCDQDYLENLWYLDLYYANSSMRGTLPPHFCNGLWGFFHDFVPWNCYFHYNGQLAVFPLETCNHPELTETYHRFRRDQLPAAERFAHDVKHAPGAFYTDVCDMTGRMEPGTRYNCTCGAQIAMGMLEHWRYTGDDAFLRDTALPVLRAVGVYYLSQLKPADDGYYHIYETQGYEGSPLFTDSITDLSMIQVLFRALSELLPPSEAGEYRERLAHLTPFAEAEFLPEELNPDGTIAHGIGAGRMPMDEKVLSVGTDKTGTKRRQTFGVPGHSFYGFPHTELAPLFPSGLSGLGDKDSRLFAQMDNSACLLHEVWQDKSEDWDNGHALIPIYLARLGEAELLHHEFEPLITAWMRFPQGLGLYADTDFETNAKRFGKYTVQIRDTGETAVVPTWFFRHLDYETLPILTTAVNEMLLQSYDGVLRLFPAVRESEQYAFRLAAVGGFLVQAVYESGLCEIRVTSTRGGVLRLTAYGISSPLRVTDADGNAAVYTEDNGVFRTETVPGQELVFRNADGLSLSKDYSRNTDVKRCGGTPSAPVPGGVSLGNMTGGIVSLGCEAEFGT